MGFISKGKDSTLVDIFSVGNQVLKLEMGNLISINDGIPIPYPMFNIRFLNSNYPSKTIKYIFLGKAIFNGKNLEKDGNMFSQKIGNIIYTVSPKKIYFKDIDNGIMIKIKKF